MTITQQNQAELLAPAGSYESMTAAVAAGADAVYLGGQLFGARAYAENLDMEQLKRAIDYVHIHGRALYLTVNTLLKEEELEEKLYQYLLPLYREGLDAVIVQDMGVLALVREAFPKLPIHASTQMSLTGVHGARMMKELGVTRIVTARELSLSEIQEIYDKVDIEIESFVHGALCYSYSGQCLFSSIAGGRSGNRGRCAQPCRLPYLCERKRQYYLSPKDLCAVGILPEMLRAGVYSFKIEGRMKKPEYTAGVVSIYRRYLDRCLSMGEKETYIVEPEDRKQLFDIYNRGGFTEGYYKKHNGKDMMFLEGREGEAPERNETLFETIRRTYIEKEQKEKISGHISLHVDMPVTLSVSYKDVKFQVCGERAERAQRQPLNEENIRKQLGKLGNTPFVWERLSVDTDDKSFLSVTALNELRRSAVEQLEKEILAFYQRQDVDEWRAVKEISPERSEREAPRLHVYLEKPEYVDEMLSFEEIDTIYLDCCAFDENMVIKLCGDSRRDGRVFYYVLPHIFRAKEEHWLDKVYETLCSSGLAGFVVKNYEEIEYLVKKGCSLPLRCDNSIYIYNQRARKTLVDYAGFEFFTLPAELNERELRRLSSAQSELVVYGRIPMMVSAQCVRKNTGGCTKQPEQKKNSKQVRQPKELVLTDRYKNEFPVKNQCRFCYNKIYNCKPLSLLSSKNEVDKLSPGAVRLDFTTESVQEAKTVTECFINAYKRGIPYREEPWEFTRGHFKRGVE